MRLCRKTPGRYRISTAETKYAKWRRGIVPTGHKPFCAALASSVAVACYAPRLDALEDLRVWRAFDFKETGSTLLQAAQAMVDENISPRYLRLEFHHRCPARRDKCGLHIAHGLGCSFRMDLVKNFADDMEARHEIRASIAEKDANRFADLGF